MADYGNFNWLAAAGLLDALGISVVSITTDLAIEDFNSSAASLLGIDEQSLDTPLPALYPALNELLLSSCIAEAVDAEECMPAMPQLKQTVEH